MAPVDELVGRCAQMTALREQIRALLAREANLRRLPPIMITGETGTGKGLVAQIIHRSSSRSNAQFVAVNGAAIPETLLESELFGYERGAFTDARQSKPGLIQVAHRGTLFLDEVALLPVTLQAKLLKVVEDASVRRLGSTRSEPVDACIISATNEDPETLIRARRLREDLYHRLAVITLALPPLRDRGDDIELLAEQALARECADQPGLRKKLGPDALAALRGHRWPGNVRELNSVMARVVLMCPTTVIPAAALELDPLLPARHEEASGRSDLTIADLERQQLSNALKRTGWNISHAAAALGITRNTVRARIARYGLRAGRLGEGPALRSERQAGDAGAPTPVPSDHDSAAAHGGRENERASVSSVGMPRGRPSIAVLPFHVEDEDLSKNYFGEGIVEDIVGALASLRELLVISRSSTLRYRGRVDVRVVGRAVGATYALSGSVRRSGTRLRVSAELAETNDGAVMWASHFDGISEDLFALQDQIATRVVATIAPQVREAELRRALRKRPDSMEAYDCVLRGMAQRYNLNLEDFTEARTWLERAIALDPGYAAPYALLADWHSIRVHQGWSTDPRADNAEVIRLATAACERDSFDAMALALCGHVKSLMLHEFDDAIALFDRAISASPSSAIAWTRSSPTYSYIGDAREAIRRAEQGLQLSPLDLHVFFAHGILGLALYVAGEHEEGIRWGRKAREENPSWTANLRFLGVNLAATGRLDEAREVGKALLAIEPGFRVDSFIEGYALRDPECRARFADHLRQAGLPG
jgi:transcriptional regulator with AAA-type ATPase domain/TolB-like protein